MAIRSEVMGKEGQAAMQPGRSTAESVNSPGLTDFAPGLEHAFPHEFQEADCVVASIDGQVPDFVSGTYYLNGPARFGINDFSYEHWLDGDGMVCSLRFDKNHIRFGNRYVRSTKFVAEREAGRPLFRTFGSALECGRLNRLNNGLSL